MTSTIKNLTGSATGCPRAEGQGTCISDETGILARVQIGDEAACEALVRQHCGRMLAVARRFFRTEEDSADAVQDAFLAAFRSLDSFEGNSTLGTWLHRVVVNACLMKLRAQSRRREVQIDDLLPTFDESGHHSHPVRRWDNQALARLSPGRDSGSRTDVHRPAARSLPRDSAPPRHRAA